jgi:hypothetical protein
LQIKQAIQSGELTFEEIETFEKLIGMDVRSMVKAFQVQGSQGNKQVSEVISIFKKLADLKDQLKKK